MPLYILKIFAFIADAVDNTISSHLQGLLRKPLNMFKWGGIDDCLFDIKCANQKIWFLNIYIYIMYQ